MKVMKLKTHENFALYEISFTDLHAIPIYYHKLEDNNSESLIGHLYCSVAKYNCLYKVHSLYNASISGRSSQFSLLCYFATCFYY